MIKLKNYLAVMVLCISQSIYSNVHFCNKTSLVVCDYYKAFGEECDLLLYKSNKVVRDIYIIESSISNQICKEIDLYESIHRAYIQISFIDNCDSTSSVDNVEIRFFDSNSIQNDEELYSKIKAIVMEAQIKQLQKTSKKKGNTFTIAFSKKCSSINNLTK